MDKQRIAALLTCHNRRETTLVCLQRLFEQQLPEHIELEVYLVDDGCTDGTAGAVEERFPDVKVITGTGDLFWCGGMRLAWEHAFKGNYDHYLWLNDDTHLFPEAVSLLITTLLQVERLEGKSAVVAGSTCDSISKALTYGGVVRRSWWQPMGFVHVSPGEGPKRVHTINGNCVLIPRSVAQKAGNLSDDFTHGMGDFDYGLRAGRYRFSCWITSGFVGTCSGHQLGGSFYDSDLPAKARIAKMHRPTGLPPVKEWMRFTRKHAGYFWPVYWLRTWLRSACPHLWVFLRRGSPQ